MSVAIAFVAWFVAIIVTDRQSTVIISNVPVEADLANTQTEQLGFDVIKINPEFVSVKVKGPRYKIGLLTKNDISVKALSFRNVTSDGNYEIGLKAEFKQIMPDVKIDSISKDSAIFSVDVLTSKLVTLTCSLPNISAQEGFLIDSPICQPQNIYVSGPKKLVDCLKEVRLDVNSSQKNLDSTKTFDAQPKFISISGREMDSSGFKYNEAVKFSVSVPIYKLKSLPFNFMFKNAPKSLNLNLLKNCVKISPDYVNLGLANDVSDSFKEICLGYIDMRELDFDTKFNFKVEVPSGCKNLDRIETAVISFNTDNWDYKKFDVDDIQIINVDDDFDVEVKSAVLGKVKVVGFSDFLKSLNGKDITATVDLSNVKLKLGEQIVPVNVGILNKDGVWPVGFYKCRINVKNIKK